MTATRVILIDRPGRAEVLRLAEQEVPAPIGLEAVGVIEHAAPGVPVMVGDRVAYSFPPPGAYADRRCMAAGQPVPVPDGLSDDLVAAVFNKGLTAHDLAHATHRIVAGETILGHAAAGGVGSLLRQWAAAKGARVIGTVGSPAKAAIAASNGCAHVIDNMTEDQVSFGTASGPIAPLDLFELNRMGSLYVTSPGCINHVEDRAELPSRANDVFAAVAADTLRMAPPRVYPLAEAARAHRDLQGRSATGVAILRPAPDAA